MTSLARVFPTERWRSSFSKVTTNTRSVPNQHPKEDIVKDLLNNLKRPANRRSFMKRGLAAAGTATMGAGLVGKGVSLFGQDGDSGDLTRGDIAILRLLAAAEILEED